MAIKSVTPQPSTVELGYHLPSQDRQSILAQTDKSKRDELIERQRQKFTKKYGGDEISELTH